MDVFKLKSYDANSLLTSSDEIDFLGRGNYASFRLCHQKELKKVVVKTLTTSGSRSKINENIDKAEEEAQILSRLDHKNIVRVYGITRWSSFFGIIMELVTCGNLEDLLYNKRIPSIPYRIMARFFLESANAIDYLHYHDRQKYCIHGDLKPQNILLTDELVIKLADFGAAAIAQSTGAKTITVDKSLSKQDTPFYFAPEYLANPYLKQAREMDIFSYGMIGYEILSKKQVYQDSHLPADVIMFCIMQDGLKPDTNIFDQIEKSLENQSPDLRIFTTLKEMVTQCWQTKPLNRPVISDVKERLDALAQSVSIYDEATNDEARSLAMQMKTNIASGDVERKTPLTQFCPPFERVEVTSDVEKHVYQLKVGKFDDKSKADDVRRRADQPVSRDGSLQRAAELDTVSDLDQPMDADPFGFAQGRQGAGALYYNNAGVQQQQQPQAVPVQQQGANVPLNYANAPSRRPPHWFWLFFLTLIIACWSILIGCYLNYPSCKETVDNHTCPILRRRDCTDVAKQGYTKNGLYNITICARVVEVYCDLEASDGNWTVIQRRLDGHMDFYRDWRAYEDGFGNKSGEFWLGLTYIQLVTAAASYELRIDLQDWEGNTAYAQYRNFSIGSSVSNYTLNIGGFSGNAGDSLSGNNHDPFTTMDRDNDGWNTGNCAVERHGGWWYHACTWSNLNGQYYEGVQYFYDGVEWYRWKDTTYSMKRTEMKIRRK